MSAIDCDMVRVATLDPREQPRGWMARPEVAAHLRGCENCRDWLEAFGAGEQAWAAEPAHTFADSVIARTTGVARLVAALPSLAELDPGPGFTERVLLATSRKPAPEGWRARLAASWWSLVGRPRFAWEAAYVATVCWVLLFGNPVGAWEWGAAGVSVMAREHLDGPVRELRGDLATFRARWAPEPEPVSGVRAPGPDVEPPVVRVWQAGTKQAERATSYVLGVLAGAWARVDDWFGWLVNQLWSPATEPDARPVRSAQ